MAGKKMRRFSGREVRLELARIGSAIAAAKHLGRRLNLQERPFVDALIAQLQDGLIWWRSKCPHPKKARTRLRYSPEVALAFGRGHDKRLMSCRICNQIFS